eukprot:TRINITY_DN1855_c0_g1_i4.p1 TRINITY_DN1855_c0_g1~~TRINITY_DN1855_c0_g1_i4.p1  ORF type:complete len:169 (-),score=32.30 TRINITY_DN1855_c0_g1_i4:183-689(-)
MFFLTLRAKKEFKRSPGKHIAKKDNIIQFWIKRRNAREKRENRQLEGFTRKRKRPEKKEEIRRNEKNSTLPPTATETKGVEEVKSVEDSIWGRLSPAHTRWLKQLNTMYNDHQLAPRALLWLSKRDETAFLKLRIKFNRDIFWTQVADHVADYLRFNESQGRMIPDAT